MNTQKIKGNIQAITHLLELVQDPDSPAMVSITSFNLDLVCPKTQKHLNVKFNADGQYPLTISSTDKIAWTTEPVKTEALSLAVDSMMALTLDSVIEHVYGEAEKMFNPLKTKL